MNKYVMWAIDPKNKPSMSDMRIAFLASDDRLLKRRQSYGYCSVKIGSVGVIPIKDALYNSDYIRISSMIDELNNDPEVTKILLDINSPGGVVNGAIECASIIAKSKKPVYVYIEGMGCSAAYLLASASRKIIMSPSSEAGSIGVQASWTNMEGFWAKLGIHVQFLELLVQRRGNLRVIDSLGRRGSELRGGFLLVSALLASLGCLALITAVFGDFFAGAFLAAFPGGFGRNDLHLRKFDLNFLDTCSFLLNIQNKLFKF